MMLRLVVISSVLHYIHCILFPTTHINLTIRSSPSSSMKSTAQDDVLRVNSFKNVPLEQYSHSIQRKASKQS